MAELPDSAVWEGVQREAPAGHRRQGICGFWRSPPRTRIGMIFAAAESRRAYVELIEAAIAQLDLDTNAGATCVVTPHGVRIRRPNKLNQGAYLAGKSARIFALVSACSAPTALPAAARLAKPRELARIVLCATRIPERRKRARVGGIAYLIISLFIISLLAGRQNAPGTLAGDGRASGRGLRVEFLMNSRVFEEETLRGRTACSVACMLRWQSPRLCYSSPDDPPPLDCRRVLRRPRSPCRRARSSSRSRTLVTRGSGVRGRTAAIRLTSYRGRRCR